MFLCEAFRDESPLDYCSDHPGTGYAMFDFGFGGAWVHDYIIDFVSNPPDEWLLSASFDGENWFSIDVGHHDGIQTTYSYEISII